MVCLSWLFHSRVLGDDPFFLLQAVILGTIDYLDFHGPSEHIPARERIREVVQRVHLSSHSFTDALIYKEWETDEVIGAELYRNIGLAMVCIFVISLTMLADVKISLMVMACVILTMVKIYAKDRIFAGCHSRLATWFG